MFNNIGLNISQNLHVWHKSYIMEYLTPQDYKNYWEPPFFKSTLSGTIVMPPEGELYYPILLKKNQV